MLSFLFDLSPQQFEVFYVVKVSISCINCVTFIEKNEIIKKLNCRNLFEERKCFKKPLIIRKITSLPFLPWEILAGKKLEVEKLGAFHKGRPQFLRGRRYPIADICQLEGGGRGLRNADVCIFLKIIRANPYQKLVNFHHLCFAGRCQK